MYFAVVDVDSGSFGLIMEQLWPITPRGRPRKSGTLARDAICNSTSGQPNLEGRFLGTLTVINPERTRQICKETRTAERTKTEKAG